MPIERLEAVKTSSRPLQSKVSEGDHGSLQGKKEKQGLLWEIQLVGWDSLSGLAAGGGGGVRERGFKD